MNLRIASLLVLFSVVFLFRLNQLGGLDKEYVDETVTVLGLKFDWLRDYFSSQAEYLLPSPQSSLLVGMVIGAPADMPSEFKKALKNTSTIHMVVVSGQNLTLLSGFVLSLVKFIGRKKSVGLSLGIVLLYSLLSGFEVPAIRAALMLTLASVATLFNREGDSWWILLVSALAMLAYNPNWLLSISFQLSFLATFGVIVVAPQVNRLLTFIPEILREDLAVTISAQALVLPVIASNFHSISTIGVLSNIFLLWSVPIIMVSGLIVLSISVVSIFLAQILVVVPGILLTYFVYIVEFFNKDYASIYIGQTSTTVWVGYYLIVLALLSSTKNLFKT